MKILGMGMPEMVIMLIYLVPFIACLIAISLIVKAAQAKGWHKDGTGKLWFIGIFATPVVLGLYVAALPDRGQSKAKLATQPTNPAASAAQDVAEI